MAGANSSGAPAFPWGVAIVLALPALALAVTGGVIGIATPAGAAVAGAGALYLAIELFVLQPKVEQRMLMTTGGPAAAQGFLERALAFTHVDEVATEFARAVTGAAGANRVLLVVPSSTGELRFLGEQGPAPSTELTDPSAAFLWLGECDVHLTRDDLAASTDEGAAATLVLLEQVGCNVALPLRHRGLLLGLGLVSVARPAAHARFFRAMRAYTTVAVANTLLDAEARDRGALTKTFDLATAMQESLMPDERPVYRDGFELRGMFRPVAECGGDLWVWRELADGKVLLLVADATGHGVAPALLAAVAKGAIDAHWQMALDRLDPAQLLLALDRAVHRTGQQRYMMTGFAAVVDTRAGELHYANAGQNFPYFVNAPRVDGGRRVEPLIARGNALGAGGQVSFTTQHREMGPGDKLFLYTDGLTEAGSPGMEPWGEKRLRAALEAMADERAGRLPELLMSEVDTYLGGHPLSDDITIVAFHYGNVEAEE